MGDVFRPFYIEKPRLLLGPGPSPVPEAVRRAMAEPVVGHLDPQFLSIMDDVQNLLRNVFGTRNRMTFPVSGTGSAGMETALVNFVEPGDQVVVVVAGLFGLRIKQAALKLGAEVVELAVPWGQAATRDQLGEVLARHPRARLVAVVMAETSTGVLQPLAGWADVVHEAGALLMVDAVTAIGGMPIEADRHQFDIVFAGTQKCLSAPPGLAPLTISDRAAARLEERKSPVPSWYLDLTQVQQYWGRQRVYHHTAPVSMIYALYAALQLVDAEGLEARYRRHRRVAASLWAGLQAMGLELLVDPAIRLPSLTTVVVPSGVDERDIRQRLLEDEGIEIGGGLGQLAGKVWRIGSMGQGARLSYMMDLLAALRRVLATNGLAVDSGLPAAEDTYRN